jgi:hypothetical protein
VAETLDQAGTLGAPPADSEFAATPEQGQPAGTQSEAPAAEMAVTSAVPEKYVLDGEELTPEQIKQWREIATNPQKFVASATQKAQEASQMRAEAERMRTEWEQQRNSFMNDERTRELVQLRQAIDADPTLYARVQRALAAAGGQQQTDQIAGKLMSEIRQLKDWKSREEWERQQRYQKDLEAETGRQLEDFTKAHPDIPDKEMGEFTTFYESRPDIVSFEDAWRLFSYDQVLAKTRQAAMDETAQVEVEKKEAVGVPPKAHTKVAYQPDPADRDFEKAREASLRSGVW